MEDPEVPTEHLHEHMEHQAKHAVERWILGVALSSAILAAMAAVASMKAGHFSNEAMISQIEAANQWAFFQGKSIKEAQLKTKVEILDALGKPRSVADAAKLGEYEHDKGEIQKEAETKSREARHALELHSTLAHSVTMFQIAIAVGAISVLTRRRLFWFVSLGFGVVGAVFVAQSWVQAAGH